MTRKLQLLCIGRDLSPAGAERVQAALFRHLDRSRFSVDLHYMSDGDDLLDEMPADLVPRFGRIGRVPRKLDAARTLHRLVQAARRSDLIFATQEGSPVYLAAIAGAVARKPVVGWIHGLWSRLQKEAGGWHALASRILYPRASRLVCVSEGVRRDLESESPSLADRLAVLPNPLDIERIRTQSLEPAPPWAANFPDEGAIVACGRLVPDKGFDLLLRAFAKSASCRRGTRLVVLGEGPERARLESLGIELGLRGRVSLPGHLANPYPVFRRAAVFVLSSRVEGVGMVLLEAMTLSVPVVALDSDAGGPREIFGAQDCGQLVEAGDPGRLADAIDRMLGDRALAVRCRDWGERRARKFDAERAARRFETLSSRCWMLHVLVAHNYYRHPGGEDAVYEATGALLEARGHRVMRFTAHNDATASMSRPALAKAALWNRDVCRRLRATMRAGRPNVAHFMNTFPLISPAAYHAARDEGVPVVQTLHNYRLFCVNGLFFREGRVCEDCAGKSVSWPGAVRGCYRNSRAASAVAAAVSGFHRLIGTWSAAVDIYVALTEFARRKFVDCGLPVSKVVVHPNFLHNDPGFGTGAGGYALFAGRLSAEKGLSVLLDAWQKLGGKTTLKIAGDGPLAAQAASQSRKSGGIEYLGRCSSAEVLALMRDAAFLVLPSECYEGLPMAIVEAFASGLPVIAAGHGGMSTLIEHGRTGLHFRPGDSEDLAANLQWAFSHPAVLARMRTEARAEFEARYTAEKHYHGLVEIYERAMSGN